MDYLYFINNYLEVKTMAIRHHKTKKSAQEYLKGITRESFGSSRPIRKQIRKTKSGYTSSVTRR